MSHTVNQSTRELGLRIALGASAKDLLQLVFTQGFYLTAAGVVIGSATALLLTRLIGALLYQVNPRDPVAFASAFTVLTITAIAAVSLPALRVTKTDPARCCANDFSPYRLPMLFVQQKGMRNHQCRWER